MELKKNDPSSYFPLLLVATASLAEKRRPLRLTLPLGAERRNMARFKVGNELLCVSDSYAGQILDISAAGMAFRLVDFHSSSSQKLEVPSPPKSENLGIIKAGPFSVCLMRNLLVKKLHDRKQGMLHPGRSNIVIYRRTVLFLTPLAEEQLQSLHLYFSKI